MGRQRRIPLAGRGQPSQSPWGRHLKSPPAMAGFFLGAARKRGSYRGRRPTSDTPEGFVESAGRRDVEGIPIWSGVAKRWTAVHQSPWGRQSAPNRRQRWLFRGPVSQESRHDVFNPPQQGTFLIGKDGFFSAQTGFEANFKRRSTNRTSTRLPMLLARSSSGTPPIDMRSGVQASATKAIDD